ncbi:asparagine synthase (glutamine-hydrolyzing) [soil metagenome]
MCGIVGFVAARGAALPDPRGLEDAVAALAHRGPDGRGIHRADAVALGNTRLSIIDLPGGSQPMTNEDGSVVVVYNGEIWNYRALRNELARLGHRFQSHSDTEVLVHGYEAWGDDLPAHLDGMFAFAVWDAQRERLFLARDRLGKKPLYLFANDRGLAFGSDARSLFLVAGLRPELDRAKVAEYLFRRYVISPGTLFSGVERLAPAHRASYDRLRLDSSRYWQLEVPEKTEPFEPRELRNLLQHAVERRLMSDVPLGVLLSGGVDSAAVLALAHQAGARSLATFTIGFDDNVFDERRAARISAAAFGADHHEVVVDRHDFLEALPRLAWFRDEPVAEASEIPLLLLAEFAGRHVKVALTGDGGDEVFGGYPKYRVDATLRMGGWPAAAAVSAVLRLAARRRTHRQLERAARTVTIRDSVQRWANWFRSFDPGVVEDLLAPELAEEATAASLAAPLAHALEPYAHLDAGRRMLLGDLFTYLPDNMLLRSDKVLMAASLEGRMPLLDIDLVARSSASSAGDRASLRGAKRTIRKAIEGLVPEEILRQPKRGFPVPVERFLVDDTRAHLVSLVLSERAISRGIFRPDRLRAIVSGDGAQIGGRELFVLASLEIWMRANVDTVSNHPSSFDELMGEPPAPRGERMFVRAHGDEGRSRPTQSDVGREDESPPPVLRPGPPGADDSAPAERQK